VAERLWREVHDRLTAFVARRVDEPADVADIVQTVFLSVHRHAERIADGDRLLPWLFQVTRNAIADFYRAPARRREVPADADPKDELPEEEAGSARVPFGLQETIAISTLSDAAVQGALAELATCVRPMVEQLPPIYRDALTLVEFDHQAQADAAARLGVSVSGMKSRVQRGRALLREVLLECCDVNLSATGGVMDFTRRVGAECETPCLPVPLPIRRQRGSHT
jgi:RNA polymerase sigma-70 factor (ECF subfamily)